MGNHLLFSLLCFLSQFHTLLCFPTSSRHALAERGSNGRIHFEVDLTWEEDNTVGIPKQTILVNGTSPGPVLYMAVGDTVEFVVHNYLPFSTTIHFHGITQLLTPWSDGVPGVSQMPIAPGATFVYEWTADEYGQYFYHAHHRGQIDDGLVGAIVISPPADETSPFSLISASTADIAAMEKAELAPHPLIVSDWKSISFEDLFAMEVASGVDITCPDTIVINGKGSVQCPGVDFINSFVTPQLAALLNGSQLTAKGCLPPIPALLGPFPHDLSALTPEAFDECTPSQGLTEIVSVDAKDGWASINLISSAGISTLEVSIDDHKLYVYAADGRYITPQVVDAVVVPNGNRYTAMIKLDQPAADYTIRVAAFGLNQVATGLATLSYAGSSGPAAPNPVFNYAGQNLTAEVVLFSDTAIVPFETVSPSLDVAKTFLLEIKNEGASYLWTLSGLESYSMNLEDDTALLFDPTSPAAQDSNLTISTNNGTWVDFVIQVLGPLAPPHPIHKHSNKAFIIGQGVGAWNWTTVAEAAAVIPQNFNFVNPPLRDGFTTPPVSGTPTWMAVRYRVVNPGAFLMHCHIQTHLSGGMAIAILDGIDAFPVVPEEYLTATFPGY